MTLMWHMLMSQSGHLGDDMRVIYLAGMSHSGSTLLSLMLNAHPDICAAGELIDLERCSNWP